MKKIGLTGGIGSGKTFISKLFTIKYNTPIYYSDEIARDFMLTEEGQHKISSVLGEKSYIDGQINKKHIRDKMFSDTNLLEQVNSIISNYIRSDFQKWCDSHSDKDYVIFESALIFESGQTNNFDKILTITVSDTIRKERVVSRDKLSDKEYELVLNNQMSDSLKINDSDFTIDTSDKTEEELIKEIIKINSNLC